MIKNKFELLFIIITFFSLSLNSQEKEKSDMGNLNLGLFISPVFEVSRMNNANADFIGINAGVISQENETGISIQKLYSTITRDITDLDSRLKFDILSGEIYYNRYFEFYKKLYLSIGLSIGSAYTKLKYKGALVREKPSGPPCCLDEIFASDTYCIIKPHVNINYGLNKNIQLNIGLGYRMTTDLKMNYKIYPYLINYESKDFNYFFASLSVKYIFILK
jgi:hypothetical protein